MSDKVKVKDLAAELGVGNKDVLNVLRDLEIPVKSLMSTLTQEQADEVRGKLANAAPVAEVVRKEVQPGVIVRRRKRQTRPARKESEDAEAAAPATETAEAETPVEPPVESPAEPEEAAAPVAEKTTAPAKEPSKPSGARVVRKAGEVAPAPEPEPEAEPVTAAEPEAEPVAAAGPEEAENAAAEPEEAKAAAGEEAVPEKVEAAQTPETEEEGAPRRKDRKRDKTAPQVQVKVISKPEPRPERPKPARRRPAAPGTPAKPAEPATDDHRGRRKDKRVVDFGGPAPASEPRRKGAFKRRKEEPSVDRTGGRGRPRKGGRRARFEEAVQPQQQPTTAPMKAAKRKIKVEDAIRVSDLAHQMGIKAPEIIRVLMGLGVMATINQSLDFDTTTLVAGEFGYEVEKVGFSEDEFLLPAEPDKDEQLQPRPPVVTIMGHVDHGKTSLLDAIRSSSVTSGEAGGITQHIGAYHVETPRGEIVFLDTPGHEAFTAMRARGAQVTDLVVLVVAADDGVMDQTREALNHSKAAGVPLLVAVNKIDKEDANPDRVKRELAEFNLVPEDWGGETIFANVSAKQRVGIDELLELILLQAEVLELKANPDKPARGHIVEAKLDKGRGPVGTVLIQEGTLKQGDSFVCGLQHGKVRAMFNDQGQKIDSAGPAIPIEVQGFDGVPEAGDEFVCVTDEKVARRIAETRQTKQRERDLARESKVTLESFLTARKEADIQKLNVVLKADVQGSLEAIVDALNKLSTEEVKIDVVHAGAGAISESDILLASASEAIIIGFNIRPTAKIKEVADNEQVEIRFYDIIYKLVADVKDAMAGMLAPVITEKYLGQAEVRETFSVPKVGTVAGCMISDGKLLRNANVRLLREGAVIYTGKLSSLRRFKDDVKEVAKGYECGVGLENYNDIKIGDVIEAFREVEEKATLD